MAVPAPQTMRKVRVVIQRPAGTFLVYLPGGRVKVARDREEVDTIIDQEACGGTPVFE